MVMRWIFLKHVIFLMKCLSFSCDFIKTQDAPQTFPTLFLKSSVQFRKIYYHHPSPTNIFVISSPSYTASQLLGSFLPCNESYSDFTGAQVPPSPEVENTSIHAGPSGRHLLLPVLIIWLFVILCNLWHYLIINYYISVLVIVEDIIKHLHAKIL